MRKVVAVTVAILALAFATNASASGPQVGVTHGGEGVTSRNGTTRYVVVADGGSHSIAEAVQIHGGRILSSYTLEGTWGIPAVTIRGNAGGLSYDGQLLVLADASTPTATLHSQTTFLLMSTTPVALQQFVRLKGDFAFDALSPDNRTLYLIQHVSAADLTSYRVRAYDLRQNRLLPGAIAEKKQAGWDMSGYPVARATSPDGRWVYTLYRRDGGYPFVHALDSANRTAVCIGLPWPERENQNALTRAALRLDGRKLTISVASAARFVLDTQTYAVTKPQVGGTEAVVPGAAAAAFVLLVCAGFALRRRLRVR